MFAIVPLARTIWEIVQWYVRDCIKGRETGSYFVIPDVVTSPSVSSRYK